MRYKDLQKMEKTMKTVEIKGILNCGKPCGECE
jgi:hypothetical protein